MFMLSNLVTPRLLGHWECRHYYLRHGHTFSPSIPEQAYKGAITVNLFHMLYVVFASVRGLGF